MRRPVHDGAKSSALAAKRHQPTLVALCTSLATSLESSFDGPHRHTHSDVAMFDVEVVDANGQRCPTDEARVDFAMSGA
jgi:hypothetical protein